MVKPITEEIEQQIIDGAFMSCEYIHDHSCFWYSFIRFFKVCKKVYRAYILLYLLPLIIFKQKSLKEKPKKVIISTFVAYCKSVAFIGLFVSILTYGLCVFKNLRQKVDGINVALASLFCSFACFIESESRRKEINLFILPRTVETIYLLLRRRGYIMDLSNHGNVMFGIILALTNYIYQNKQHTMQKNFLNIIQRCWKTI